MNRRLACHGSGLALAYEAPGVNASEPSSFVEVLVGGTPQHRYAHQGRWYIEALKGREYRHPVAQSVRSSRGGRAVG